MAKITIAGDAFVITSSMKLEDIKMIEKYRPEKLVLMGGEDGKEPMFAIGTTNGIGSINGVGASFGSKSHNAEELATITMSAVGYDGDIKEWIADKIGKSIIDLKALEATLPDVIDEIKNEKEEIMSNIEIAQ